MSDRDNAPSSAGWYASAFGPEYEIAYRHRDAGQAELEAGFVFRELALSPGDRVLDLGCGFGRHLKAFPDSGLFAVGLDLSPHMISRAAAECPGANLVRGDMRKQPFFMSFDAVLAFFTVLGYFDDAGNRETLDEVASSLKPGGKFVFDLPNPPFVRDGLVAFEESEAAGRKIAVRREIRGRRVEKTIEIEGRPPISESVMLYEEAELREIAAQAGLTVEKALGGFDGSPLMPSSARMVLIGRRGPLRVSRVGYGGIASFGKRAAWLALSGGRPGLDRFLPLPPAKLSSFAARAKELEGRRGLSESLRLTLLAHNRRLGCGKLTEYNIGLLSEGRALAIVTGQQPGLLGGPALLMHKTLTAVSLCRLLAQRGLGDFVPVFWSASEDHDSSEFTSVYVPDRDGAPSKISIGLPPEAAGKACSAIDHPGLLEPAVEDFLGHLPDNAYKPGIEAVLRSLPLSSPSEAFGSLLQRMFPGLGLVVVEPSFFRPEGLPIFEQEILDPDASVEALRSAGRELLAAGFEAPLQRIEPTNLFMLDEAGRRERIGWDGDNFSLNGAVIEPEDILSSIERISTNVALRPLVQDMALPVAAYVAGPGEAAYFAQLKRLYRLFGLPAPLIFPRISATFMLSREISSLKDAGLSLEDALSGRAPESRPSPLPARAKEALDAIGADVAARVAAASAALGALPENLEKRLAGFADFAARKAGELRDDVAKALDRETAEKARKALRAVRSASPGGRMQERRIAWLFYVARHGPLLAEEMIASCDPFDFRHHVLVV